MSYPVIYDGAERTFSSLGLGVLKDGVTCLVTEEVNGRFELEMTYPVAGAGAEHLVFDNLIKVDCGHASFSKGQLFRIDRVDKQSEGLLHVYATHVSALARHSVLRPEIHLNNQTGTGAMNGWHEGIVGAHPFEVTSDIGAFHTTVLRLTEHDNAWGGERMQTRTFLAQQLNKV